MMSSNTYHFTPPTCTLEIINKKPFFLHLASSDSLNKFRFKLKFDDPRQPTAKQVTIQGDKQDLVQLQAAVDRYLKNQLQASFRFGKITTKTIAEAAQELHQPRIKSQGLTSHELLFGSLTHDGDRPQIILGTVQLFDLATALEAYQSTVSALAEKHQVRSSRDIALKGGIAAVAIVTVLIALILRPQTQPQTASRQYSQPEREEEQNGITPPAAPSSDRPTTSKPKLREPLASAKRLPPPPAVETPKPKPDIPDPANYPLADVGRQAGLDNLASQNGADKRSLEPEIIVEQAETLETAIPTVEPQAENDWENTDPEANLSRESSEALPSVALENPPSQLSQVEQVTKYFQANWQPPADLNQSLEYRLFINSDGAIERVVPLGKAARLYLDRTGIPLNGEPFISDSEAESAIVRLLLDPNGRVQAVTERTR